MLDAANSYDVANKGAGGKTWHKDLNKDLGGNQVQVQRDYPSHKPIRDLRTQLQFYDGLHLAQRQRRSLGV